MTAMDMVVCGSVAVSPDGARLGKGGGFSDLEFAIAREAGLVSPDTVIVTTVHDLQLVDTGTIPMTIHDVPVDIIVTSERTIHCERRHPRPSGVHWDELTEAKIAAIPILAALSRRLHQRTHTR
jgi:5-formyltetrahydrofolate cyclo-ligase